jgi:riboflavin synthase
MQNMHIGDSIAINGACMTMVTKNEPTFTVHVSRESLNCTHGLNKIGPVNLERALTLNTPLGGHLVSGHVDGIGTVHEFTQQGESKTLIIQANQKLAKYLAIKGSVVVNGVSLTINKVNDLENHCLFSINLIPHTLTTTTLQYLNVGCFVNLEIDLIARYVERMLSTSIQAEKI